MAPENPASPPVRPEKGGPGGKITNRLVALGSAAVLTVYAAGYARTRSAADRFVVEAADLGTGAPLDLSAPVIAAPPPAEAPIVPEAPPVMAATAPAERFDTVAPGQKASVEPPPAAIPESSPAPASSEASTPSVPAAPVAPSAQPTPSPAASTAADTSTAANDSPSTPATPAAPESPAPAPPPASLYKDGRYLGWGYSRHGDIEADIVIVNGRIISTQITQCLTRYSCDIIAQSPGQVLERQSPYIDIVSGATESANAYANAVYRAMKAAKN